MAIMVLNDSVLVTINGIMDGQTVLNTFGYQVTALPGTVHDETIFPLFRDRLCSAGELIDSFRACTPTSYAITNIWIQTVKPIRVQKRVLGNTAVGASSGLAGVAANIACTILRRGDFANRKNISTLHVPAPSVAAWIDLGLPTVAALTALNALATNMLHVYSTIGSVVQFTPIIINKGTPNPVTPLTVATPEGTSRVMRRRTVGVGK